MTQSSIARPALALFLFVCASARFALGADALLDPTKPGPFPVGVTTLTLVDSSRTDPATKGPRTLLTEVWYPATDDSKNLPKNKASDFLVRGALPMLKQLPKMAFKMDMDEFDKKFKNAAVRDARMRDGKFPLIVFSHGNGGMRNQSTFWCDFMASHGYVIMSSDHTGNCAYTAVDGKVVTYNASLREQSAEDRPKDVSYEITEMGRMNKGADSRFAGRIDMDHVGVAGHSFGGFTSIHVINDDPRVDAIIPMTPIWNKRTNYTTPVLMMIGTEDKTIGADNNAKDRKYFEESKGPHYLVEMIRGGHYTFSDMGQIQPNFGDGIGKGKGITDPEKEIEFIPMDLAYEITNSYSVAFFGIYLKGQEGYRDYLDKNHYEKEIIHKAVKPPAEVPGGGGSQ